MYSVGIQQNVVFVGTIQYVFSIVAYVALVRNVVGIQWSVGIP